MDSPSEMAWRLNQTPTLELMGSMAHGMPIWPKRKGIPGRFQNTDGGNTRARNGETDQGNAGGMMDL